MMQKEMATTWWLTGLPCSGKTTLAQVLAHSVIHVEQAVQQMLNGWSATAEQFT